MAVRLQMKLGVVAETDRLLDSPDTIAVVEPSIGSVARTKGSLYLVVTGLAGRRLHEATRMVADMVRSEYYYDESAGIAVCLKKAVRSANKRLLHGRDRYVGRRADQRPVGIAMAVVRGQELYVATIGPVEAYLVRGARLLSLPDPRPDDGLPSESPIEPNVWRGEMIVGDSLILVSPNVTGRLGLAPVQEAAVTLHPQAAVEQLHRRYVEAAGEGSDAILVIEATEVAATHKSRPLTPVWPSDPLAGTPEHSPIPLADTVTGGMAAMQTSARHVQSAATGVVERTVGGLLDLMPRREPARRRVTSFSARRDRQRRLAVGVLALIACVMVIGWLLFAYGGQAKDDKIDSVRRGQNALTAIRQDIDRVQGAGRDLLTTDRTAAGRYLTDAYDQLGVALANGIGEAQLATYREEIVRGLNRFYSVTFINPTIAFSFSGDELAGLVLGPDGAPYVIDETKSGVFRVDITARTAKPVAVSGQQVIGGTVGKPQLMAIGGPDLLILDDHNALWRWRPADKTSGKGTLVRVNVAEASSWGVGVRAIATYVTDAEQGLYALYVVDPPARQILRYAAAADGSGYPLPGSRYLAVDQAVSDVESMLIDGSVYLAEGGKITRFQSGATTGWRQAVPGDTRLRPAGPDYSLMATASGLGEGYLYAYDRTNDRIVAMDKATSGTFVGQYMVANGGRALSSVRGMYVLPGPNGASPTLVWIDAGNLYSAPLNPSAASLSPKPSASASPSRRPSPTPTKRR